MSATADYAGKPRPAVIIQADSDGTTLVTLCPLTSDSAASRFRVPIEPDTANGLRTPSRFMVDKITTVPSGKIGKRVGTLSGDDLVRLERALVLFLGLGA